MLAATIGGSRRFPHDTNVINPLCSGSDATQGQMHRENLGARVVVNDIDAAAAQEVAASCGGEALPGDAASEAGVATLISGAADLLDGIDLYCANAGIARPGGAQQARRTGTPPGRSTSWPTSAPPGC